MYYNIEHMNDNGRRSFVENINLKERILELLERAGDRELELIYRILKSMIH